MEWIYTHLLVPLLNVLYVPCDWMLGWTERFSPVVSITIVAVLSGLPSSLNFRLAVVNTPTGSRLAANGTPGSVAYTGYSMFMNMGQTLGNSNPFQLRERVQCSAFWAEAVRAIEELAFVDRLDHPDDGCLHDAVFHLWDSQWPLIAAPVAVA